MKIYIANKLFEGPYGGGNQFLKSMRSQFRKMGLYCDDPNQATVVLFNSHQCPEEVIHLKQTNTRASFVHRLDGPMRLYNNMDDPRDMIAYQMNTAFADAIVFQSGWSKEANLKLGLDIGSKDCTVIHNATDQRLFTKRQNKQTQDKITLIASSWSDNLKKGFSTYQYLDDNLDFNKHDFIFMGRSPIEFKNIKNLGALNTQQVAEQLQKADIYLTASENDPCSNSLIEALSSGLPAICLDSGGHPELLKDAGLLYRNRKDIINKIQEVWQNYKEYQRNINVKGVNFTAKEYIDFFKRIEK